MQPAADMRGLTLRTLMPGFAGTDVPAWLEKALADGLPSVCLYGSNVRSRDQLRGLCGDLRRQAPNLLLALDEEGGDVTRLYYRTGSPYPGNAVLGRLDDVELTRRSAIRIGQELLDVGVNLDLAPVVDVNSAPTNPVIGTRSFGADIDLVARHSAAWVEGLQSTGIAACAKHFPGHGDTTTDSHRTLPVVVASADVVRARELVPFAAAVASGVSCVMTAAVVVPAIDPENPATFSPALLHDVLRLELGFRGVIVTDALDMAGASHDTGIPEAAVRALAAGCDLLCLGPDTDEGTFEAVIAAVGGALDQGRLSLERLTAAADAVTELAHRLARQGPSDIPTDDAEVPVALAFRITDAARTWRAGVGPAAIVQIETEANDAVGHAPWGPDALGLASDERAVAAAARVAVVGRNIGEGHPARVRAAELGDAGKLVILVDCGWPRGEADLVTWGGSPAVAGALTSWLFDHEVGA